MSGIEVVNFSAEFHDLADQERQLAYERSVMAERYKQHLDFLQKRAIPVVASYQTEIVGLWNSDRLAYPMSTGVPIERKEVAVGLREVRLGQVIVSALNKEDKLVHLAERVKFEDLLIHSVKLDPSFNATV